jgi:pimeloyl-ACP methyl ester carboxylesterase
MGAINTGFKIRQERVRANGLDFHVNVCGEGDRLALCLHGFPELGFSWRHQLPLLASLGYRAWAPDLRGYGQTDRPKGLANYAIEALLEDVAGLIDASQTSETTLLAHDWGGMIAWQFASHRVRPLERLVVMNGPPPGIRRQRFFSRQILRSWYVFFFQLPWLPELVFGASDFKMIEQTFTGGTAARKDRFGPEVVRVYKEAAARPGARTAMLNYYRGILRGGGMKRMAARGFPAIETPTLLIWGQEDPILVPSVLDGAQQFVKDMTLRFIPGAGHWVQQEAPEVANEMLAAWLRDEPVPEAPGTT